jgi:NAD-dependent SIR2 family protein deacetylase
MRGELISWFKAGSKGLGQIAFCNYWQAGILIMIALAAVSWLHAAAGAAGTVAGTVASRVLSLRTFEEWREGLAGANPAIVGIFWASLFDLNFSGLAILVVLFSVCIGLDWLAARQLGRIGLPSLSIAAMATIYLCYAGHAVLGLNFWPPLPPLPTLTPELVICLSATLTALAWKSLRAAALTFATAGLAALASGVVFQAPQMGPLALWGFAVAPAVFAVYGVFMAGSMRGAALAIGAGATAAMLWAAWSFSPLAQLAPPLLLPFIFSVWAAVYICRRRWGDTIQDPLLWFAAEKLRDSKRAGQPAVVITGAGVSTASGIPDYVSGKWRDENVPESSYRFDRYIASPRCRRLYWNSCIKFLRKVREAKPNSAHRALARLQARGMLGAVVTQNVDRLHQNSGSRDVIELHGRIDLVHCLSCNQQYDWPAAEIWQQYDLRCKTCRGLLKPAVIALGEPVQADTWDRAMKAVESCGLLVIVGTQLLITSAAQLVKRARDRGVRLVFVNVGTFALDLAPEDIVIDAPAEKVLPTLALLLDCPNSSD